MKKFWLRSFNFFLVALIFSACGDTIYITIIYGDNNASTESSTTNVDNNTSIGSSKTSGTVIDDYIEGADVCVDVNKNGKLEKSIDTPCVTTNATGQFIFASDVSATPLIMSGGTDIGTNKPFTGSYTAPAGSSVINPLTTIIQAVVKSGKSLDEAQEIVKTSLGLPDIDLTTYDPIAALASTSTTDIENAKKVFAQQSSIQVILTTVSTTIAATNSDTSTSNVTAQTASQIANLLIQNNADSTTTTIDIADTSNVTSILNTTAIAESNTTLDPTLVTAITRQINATSIQIIAAIDNNNTTSTIGDIRQAAAQVSTVTQDNTAAIATAIIAITTGSSTITIADLVMTVTTDTNTLVSDIVDAVATVRPSTQLTSVANTNTNTNTNTLDNNNTNPVNSLKGIALYGANLTQVNGSRH